MEGMPHELLQLVAEWGYYVVFFGAALEGEPVMMLGGFLLHGGYFSLFTLLLVAFLGAITNDSFWYALGFYKGEKILHRFPRARRFMGVPVSIAGKRPELLAFSMRFMYGLRHIVPFSIGMAGLPPQRFLFWNALGAASWVSLYVLLGFLLADVIENVFGTLRRVEFVLVLFALIAFFFLSGLSRMVQHLLSRVHARHNFSPPTDKGNGASHEILKQPY
jgi:membrane protein DedA with SNARE-associated domain